MVAVNQAQADGNAVAAMRASRNDHAWYGLLTTYVNNVNKNFDFLAGVDLRHYVGKHFREITDLLGAAYYLDNSDVNNPNSILNVGDKYSYNNDGVVDWVGGFLQGEYTQGKFNAFATFSFSNTGYTRIDYFRYLDSDDFQESDVSNHLGYQIKGGAKYALNRRHSVFANLGFFEKAPEFDAVFLNNDNFINPDAVNQKILSYELGYQYRSSKFNANVNLYRTAWLDRTLTDSFSPDVDDPSTPSIDERDLEYTASLLGVDALHQGIEIDFVYEPTKRFNLTGMVSLGDWEWSDDVDGQQILDGDQVVVGEFEQLYIGGLKVGDVAQHTYALGASYKLFDKLKVSANLNHFDKLFAEYDPITRTTAPESGEITQPLEFPSFTTIDAFVKYDFKIGALDAMLLGNVNNLLDAEYIAEGSDTPSLGSSLVYYGFGRTYTISMKVNF